MTGKCAQPVAYGRQFARAAQFIATWTARKLHRSLSGTHRGEAAVHTVQCIRRNSAPVPCSPIEPPERILRRGTQPVDRVLLISVGALREERKSLRETIGKAGGRPRLPALAFRAEVLYHI